MEGADATRRVLATRPLPPHTAYLAPAVAVGTRETLVGAVTRDAELRGRVAAALGVDNENTTRPPSPDDSDAVVAALWTVALPAGLAGSTVRPDAAWCVPPAALAAARHSDAAAAAAVAVSLDGTPTPSSVCVFTLRAVDAGEEVTVDWAPSGPRSVQRGATVLARFPVDRWVDAGERAELAEAVAAAVAQPLPGAAADHAPPRDDTTPPPSPLPTSSITVWTDYPVVDAWLDAHSGSSLFTRTTDRAAAKIVVSPRPMRHDAASSQRVNQFPYEMALIQKETCCPPLCAACGRARPRPSALTSKRSLAPPPTASTPPSSRPRSTWRQKPTGRWPLQVITAVAPGW